jgi:hypothetical protein
MHREQISYRIISPSMMMVMFVGDSMILPPVPPTIAGDQPTEARNQ